MDHLSGTSGSRTKICFAAEWPQGENEFNISTMQRISVFWYRQLA